MAVLSFKSVGEKFDGFENSPSVKPKPTPIGLITPLRIVTNQKDIFGMHYNLGDQISDNLRNLILTNHGERVGLYDFGANLRPILFDLQSDGFESEVMSRIKQAVSKYLPFVELKTFEMSTNISETSEKMAILDMIITYDVAVANIVSNRLQVVMRVGG
mgnify:CR=1 FL=1